MEQKQDYLKYIKQSFELKSQKLYREAIEVLYKVLSEETDDNTLTEVVSQIGDLHLLLKNNSRAIEQFEHVLEINPNHEHSLSMLYEIYYKEGNYAKAQFCAKTLCEISKKPVAYVKLFNVYLKLNKKEEILEVYNNLSEDLKNNHEILYVISVIDKSRKKEILEEIAKGINFHKSAKYDLALIYYNEGKFDEALKLLDDVLLAKKEAKLYYYKALILMAEKKYFDAISNFHYAIKETDGKNQQYYFDLAKAYMEINWFDEAISSIKSSITLCIEQGIKSLEDSIEKEKTESKSFLSKIADLMTFIKHTDDTEDVKKPVIKDIEEIKNQNNLKPVDPFIIDERYLCLAWIFEKKGDFDNALFNLSQIPDTSIIHSFRDILCALIKYKKGDIVAAKIDFEEIYKNYPIAQCDLTVIDTLAAIYRELKLNSKAQEFYKKHLDLYPDSIHTASEYIDLLIDMEQYDKAEQYIVKYTPKGIIPNMLNSSARIYFRKKEYEKALGVLSELLRYDKNNAETYYFKGLVLNCLNRFDEAIDYIKTALELNPKPAKYYAQGAKANFELGFLDDAMLYIKEAVEIEPNELNHKKLAALIAEKSGKKLEADFWNSIVKRSEIVLKDSKKS